MESFKKALKQAIVEKAEGVRFEEGLAPSLMLFAAERELPQLGILDRSLLETLIASLIPTASSTSDSLVEGVLNITNFGEIKLLAAREGNLRLFACVPPQGTSLYQQLKNQLTAPQARAPLKAIDLPPAAPDDAFAQNAGMPRAGHFGSAMSGSVSGTIGGSRMEEHPIHRQAPLPEPALDPLAQYAPPAVHDDAPFQGTLVRPRFDMEAAPSDPLAQYAPPSPLDAFAPPPVASPFVPTDMSDPSPFAPVDPSFKQGVPLHHQDFTGTYISAPGPGPGSPFAMPAPVGHHELEAYQAPASSALPYTPAVSHTPHAAWSPDASAPSSHAAPPRDISFGASIPGESIERNGSFAIDSVLEDMVRRKASDLHLTMKEPICMRLDGEIHRTGSIAITEAQMREWVLPIMPPKNREEFAKAHDTDFAYEVPGLARFRVNVFRDRMGVGAVLRQIPDKVLSADDLGLPPAIRKMCELNKGLVVVTGPTGSGKSTTLAAMIDLINETRGDHILTIEDPIEFVHKQKKCLINQREVHKHTQSFSRALRAALREDPDIILIGEMRDLETVEIAIETAETGHLVFGTLHTNTAISTVDRLIDQFPSEQQAQVRIMLSESLKGVVAQTLVKKKGGGRCAAQEILVIDKAVSSLIREGNTHMMQNQMQTQKAKGNQLLNDALLALVQKGLVDPKDAFTKAVEKEAFLNLLQSKGISVEGAKSAS